MSKRLWRIHHIAAAGLVDYYRYYKFETSARNALIGKGPIKQHDITHTLEVWHNISGEWWPASVKTLEGTQHYEIPAIMS